VAYSLFHGLEINAAYISGLPHKAFPVRSSFHWFSKGYETMQLGFGSPLLVVSKYVEHRVSNLNTEVVNRQLYKLSLNQSNLRSTLVRGFFKYCTLPTLYTFSRVHIFIFG